VYCLAELAEALDLEFSGDASVVITALAPLATAGPGELSFVASKKYLGDLAATGAAVVIVHPDFAAQCPVNCLISETPYASYARVTQLYNNSPAVAPGIHTCAVVSEHADVHETAAIGPNTVVEGGAIIGEGVVLAANVYVGHDSRIGADSRVFPGVVIYHNVHVGERCIVHGGAILGADGFGFAPGPVGWEKICQLGGLRIGNNVEIGACTAIDRGALEHTVVEDGVIFDNQVHIAHNCHIGKNTAIAACAGIAGSTRIGANCTFSGMVGVVGHVNICDNVHFTGMTMVTKSISDPGSYSSGTPMSPTAEWKRNAVRFRQLESMQKRLARLEAKRET